MNHFLHFLVLLPALFTTIFALPFLIEDTSNSWTDPSLDNADTLLAATFGGVTDNPLTAPPSDILTPPAPPTTKPIEPPPPADIDPDFSKPMFLCCTSTSWMNDEEKTCAPRTRAWNDENCLAHQGTARYCPRGISTTATLDCYKYRAGPARDQ